MTRTPTPFEIRGKRGLLSEDQGEILRLRREIEQLTATRDALVAALQMFDRWPVAHRQDGLRPAFEAARDLLAKLDPPRPYQRTPQQEQELEVMRSRSEL